MYVKKRHLISILVLAISVILMVTAVQSGEIKDDDYDIVLAQSPIIRREVRESYQSGSISKETAEKMIEKHLAELAETDNIENWSEKKDGQYEVILNDGTIFAYYLQ